MWSLKKRVQSFRHALAGIKFVLQTQPNAKIHALATAAAIALSIILKIDRIEWMGILLAIMAVWTAESVNTAFESLCDVASPEFHPLVKSAKDAAAGAVLFSAAGALLLAAIVFMPKMLSWR